VRCVGRRNVSCLLADNDDHLGFVMHILGTLRQQDVFFRSNDRGAWFPKHARKRGGLDIAIRDVTSVISTNSSNVLRFTWRQERCVAQRERFAGRLGTPENIAVKFPNEIAFVREKWLMSVYASRRPDKVCVM